MIYGWSLFFDSLSMYIELNVHIIFVNCPVISHYLTFDIFDDLGSQLNFVVSLPIRVYTCFYCFYFLILSRFFLTFLNCRAPSWKVRFSLVWILNSFIHLSITDGWLDLNVKFNHYHFVANFISFLKHLDYFLWFCLWKGRYSSCKKVLWNNQYIGHR